MRTAVFGTLTAVVLTSGAAYAMWEPGVDTSHYQGSKNWAAVKASGVRFAFLKATEGTGFTDPKFAADWAATSSAGLYRGAYHFARPSTSAGSAVHQADYFVSKIGNQRTRGTLPPVLDLETTGGLSDGQLITWTAQWLHEVQVRTGRTPMIYVSPAFWRDNLANSASFHAYPLWIANYGVSQPSIPGGWPTWSFWQSSSTGRITGISGNVDTDQFNGALSQLSKFALDYSPTATVVKLSSANTKPSPGGMITLRGRLTDTAGYSVPGQAVTIRQQPSGTSTWRNLATLRTDKYGNFAKSVIVNTPSYYQAAYAGSSDFKAATGYPLWIKFTPFASSLTLTPSTRATHAGGPVTLTGSLKSGKTVLAGRAVTLWRWPKGSGSPLRVGIVRTDKNGGYRLTATALQSGIYRATYAGETRYRNATAQSATVSVTRNPAAASLRLGSHQAYAGRSVVVQGTLTCNKRPVASRTLLLQTQPSGTTRWSNVAYVHTDAHGAFSYRPTVARSAAYRVYFPGDLMYAPVASNSDRVGLTPPHALRIATPMHRPAAMPGARTLLTGQLLSGGKGIGASLGMWTRRPGEHTWHFVRRVRTAAGTGAWHVAVRPSSTTSYRFLFHGGSAYGRASRDLWVIVSRNAAGVSSVAGQ